MTAIQSEVKALLDSQSEAIRTRNVDRLMSLYAPDVVYFDVVPPLHYTGAAALRGRFVEWLDGYTGSVEVDTRDVTIVASGDLVVAHWLSRVRGTLKNGPEVGSWVRVTNCFQRLQHAWLITHEHVSLAVDLKSGRPAMDLVP